MISPWTMLKAASRDGVFAKAKRTCTTQHEKSETEDWAHQLSIASKQRTEKPGSGILKREHTFMQITVFTSETRLI